MIVDEIKNLHLYNKIPQKVIDFVAGLNEDTPCGRYEINKKCFATVEVYSTKPFSSAIYEAHEKYIDIQLLLLGEEKIFYKCKDKISYPQTYDKERDIIFYNEMIPEDSHFVKLDGTNFVVIYPHEGHAPQVQTTELPMRVKKVVIKLPC